ncbi:uracil phosphoribosyltransferase [Actinoplanes palleronii]|uniref:Uracil phosphoribosyltransferase n=1 Tax=Actinoplanes palleronii TaxID=113570 RepID=A0ABQ4BRX5_9ACTN|nr:uracil phosphoribosyltransferase [Actinoplanes palleronii]
MAQTRLTAMRRTETESGVFRASLHELTTMVVYEAARLFAVEKFPIQTPVAQTEGTRLANPPLIVPVLRAGLGMADAALGLLPESSMGFVGLARDEVTHEPRAYMESLPADLAGQPVLVLDPMLATGGSLIHCCELLADRGCTDIIICCVLAAPEGVQRLKDSGLPVRLITASIDEGLNEKAYIVPGLGDAGDRQFGGMRRF